MVGKSEDQKEEIQGYIKVRMLLGCSLNDIVSEIKVVYGDTSCLLTLFVGGKKNLIPAYSLWKMHQNLADQSVRPQNKTSPK